MNTSLAIAFLFALGAMLGWVIEFFYRNLISHSGPKGKYFINPGFCRGPWLPIYGIGLSVMFLISAAVSNKISANGIWGHVAVILAITLVMTIIEFIGGAFLLKVMNLRLWDYRNEPGNIMGIVCPKFTLIWGALGAVYYLFVHEHAIGALVWLSQNLAFSFFVGLFAGVFAIDFITSAQDAMVAKRFGDEHDVIVKYEELKELVQKKLLEDEKKQKFFVQVKAEGETIKDNLNKHLEALEEKKEAFKSKRKKR